jgi:acetyl-CoA carboxylase biotin carboxylase subunit
MVSGVDIIRQQILACAAGRMEIAPENVRLNGWAVECRINALGPGTITRLDIPGGPETRFDSFLYIGCTVPPHYDSMVAKLIVHAPSRGEALDRMNRALGELHIEGITTNKEEQRRIINEPVFRSGVFGTAYYETIAKEQTHGL